MREHITKNIGLVILRVALGIVFLLFGIGKFQNDIWAQTIKGMELFQSLPWEADLSVIIIGVIELITAVCLIIGFYTRVFAIVASLQLIGILILLNFQQIRDIGLLGATLYLALAGTDWGGVGSLIHRKKQNRKNDKQ